MELALVTPILLLLFAAAADFGRAFYAYVALENAVKEGAFFGARQPTCDDGLAFGCGDPNNVEWRVQNELQGLANQDGTPVSPTSQCFAPGSTTPKSLVDCNEGDTYTVRAAYEFRLITPILGAILGNGLTLRSTATATVLNSGDPTPGASVQKYVDPTGAVNEQQIRDNCLDPNDQIPGFYRSPCLDTSTIDDPADVLHVRFDSGTTITWRLVVANSGILNLTGLSITDIVDGSTYWPSASGTCPARPTSLAIGAAPYQCTYSRTAPNVSGSGPSFEYTNILSVDASQISPATDFVTVIIERPAELEVRKSVSAYREGNDGDGTPSFGNASPIDIGLNGLVDDESVWYRLIVRSIGGKAATGLVITDSNRAIPFGQSSADVECGAQPTELVAGGSWECRYREAFSTAETRTNTLRATAGNVVGDANDTDTVTVDVTACTDADERVIPNLIGLTKTEAQAAWTDAGMDAGSLTTWSLADSDPVATQSVQAYSCEGPNTNMSITNVATP